MPSAFTAKLDRSQEERFLRRYTGPAVEQTLTAAAKAGADAAKKVLQTVAPEGRSGRQSQYYRRNGLGHGTFRKSIKAAKIRGRGASLAGLQGKTIGYVIGPMGKTGFTRAWIEYGTSGPGRHRQRANPWVERAATPALEVAESVTENKLEAYARVV